jgi:hypothetical protein
VLLSVTELCYITGSQNDGREDKEKKDNENGGGYRDIP